MSTHSVEKHLNVTAEEYDKAIRTFVPFYDEMLQTAVNILQQFLPAQPRILDLGGGTGGLTQVILAGLPGSRVTLLDIDEQMLDQARERLAPFGDRVEFLRGSFTDSLPSTDAVVASLSLHHIHQMDRKTGVYSSIRKTLSSPGLFLNLDSTVSAQKMISDFSFAIWAAEMGRHGISQNEAFEHFAAWAKEDRYFSVAEELSALAQAGFSHPECFWRKNPMSIYGAFVDSLG